MNAPSFKHNNFILYPKLIYTIQKYIKWKMESLDFP